MSNNNSYNCVYSGEFIGAITRLYIENKTDDIYNILFKGRSCKCIEEKDKKYRGVRVNVDTETKKLIKGLYFVCEDETYKGMITDKLLSSYTYFINTWYKNRENEINFTYPVSTCNDFCSKIKIYTDKRIWGEFSIICRKLGVSEEYGFRHAVQWFTEQKGIEL